MTNDSDTDGEEAKELGKSLRRPDVKIAHNTDRRNGKKGAGGGGGLRGCCVVLAHCARRLGRRVNDFAFAFFWRCAKCAAYWKPSWTPSPEHPWYFFAPILIFCATISPCLFIARRIG